MTGDPKTNPTIDFIPRPIPRRLRCDACNGSGADPDDPGCMCEVCNGTGREPANVE